LYVDTGYGRACDPADPNAIAFTLRWFYANYAEAAQMGKRGQEKVAAEWNYETQFSNVLEIMNKKTGMAARNS
jgi:hypothetical protein